MVLVERFGVLVKRMHQQRPDTGVLRNHHSPLDSVLQQGRTELVALGLMVNRQSAKHQHWNGIGHIPTYRSGCHLARDCTRSQGVIAVNAAVLIHYHKRAAGCIQLIGHGAAYEPVVENRFATVKSIQKVDGGERFGCAELQIQALTVSQGAVTAMRRSSPGLGLGGASSMAVNCSNLSLSRPKKT